MADREKVLKGLQELTQFLFDEYKEAMTKQEIVENYDRFLVANDALNLLKEQEAVEPKTIPEELKQKLWNALYAEEDKFEEKYVGTKEHDNWFLIYRPWLQKGFDLAIKAISDWEGR